MTAKSIMLSFRVDAKRLSDDDVKTKVKSIAKVCHEDAGAITEHVCKAGDVVYLALTPEGKQVVTHVYPSGLITVDFQKLCPSRDTTTRSQESTEAKKLEYDVKQWLGDVCFYSRCPVGQIKRGPSSFYFYTGDERLVEYVDSRVVFEKDTKWQNIKILQTRKFGRVLFLGDDIMIGESDIVYTNTLLGLDRNCFLGKTVLILGGGDGGLMHELLKEGPLFITMVEIDDEVISACRTHLRGVCHAALDALEGPNHKVVIDDCMAILKGSLNNGHKFDYVINDLTEDVIKSDSFCTYDFSTSNIILETSMKLLKPGGKYLSRGNAASAVPFITQFENDIQLLGMEYTRFDVDIPSFLERYCLYEVWNPKN